MGLTRLHVGLNPGSAWSGPARTPLPSHPGPGADRPLRAHCSVCPCSLPRVLLRVPQATTLQLASWSRDIKFHLPSRTQSKAAGTRQDSASGESKLPGEVLPDTGNWARCCLLTCIVETQLRIGWDGQPRSLERSPGRADLLGQSVKGKTSGFFYSKKFRRKVHYFKT